MRRSRDGDCYRWKRGPLEVEVQQSFTGLKPDWRVFVTVFGQLVADDWKPTAEKAATWANSKLHRIERALLAPRAGR